MSGFSNAGRRVAAVLMAAALVAAACSGDDDADDAQAEDAASPSTTDGAADAGADADAEGDSADAEDGSDAADGDDEAVAPAPEATGPFDIDAVLAADPDCPDPVTGEALVVGYAADLGELGAFADGPGSQTAAHMANLINCSGGLDGRPVSFIQEDISGQDPLVARDATIRLLDAGASVLLGPPFPDPGFRVLQVTDGRVPVIFTASTEPALGDDSSLAFLVSFSDTRGATAAAQFAQTQGWTTAVTFTSPGPYFGYNPRVFTEAFAALGGQVLADFPFDPFSPEVDFTEAIQVMVDTPPDVVYSAMLANQLVALRAALDEAGLTDVQILGSDAFEVTGGYSLTGNEGIYHVTHVDPRPGSRVDTLEASIASVTGVAPASPAMTALAGDAMAVIADAYLRTQSTDPVVLGEAIANAPGVQGITGVLRYDSSGAPIKPMYVQQVVNGEPTLAGIIGG